MRNRKVAGLVGLVVAGVVCSGSAIWAQQTRLRARKNKVVNGLEAQLRGDYRETGGSPSRLSVDLENINIPVGTPVAFCLVDSVTLTRTKIAEGPVAVVGGILVASAELNLTDGEFVPAVNIGDKLQARQKAVAPFTATPDCSTHQLVSAVFK